MGLWIMTESEQEELLAVVLVMHVTCSRRVGVRELRRVVIFKDLVREAIPDMPSPTQGCP